MRLHSYSKIINYLQNNKGTYREIAMATCLPYNGVTSRISELRSYGVPIESCGGEIDAKLYLNKRYLKDKNKFQFIPFEFQSIQYPGGETIAISIPMEFHNKAIDTESLLSEFKEIIKKCKELVEQIEKNKKIKDKKKDTLLNWEIGDILFNFQNKFKECGLYCFNYDEILEKFIGKAGKGGRYRREYWRVRREFRDMCPDKEKLMPFGFNIYNEIRVVSDIEKRKILYEFIKKRFIKTNNTPSIKEIREKRHEIGGTRKGKNCTKIQREM